MNELVSSGVSKTYQGTGLGLHICRLHVEVMGGMIGVASSVNEGTRFLVAIPFQILKSDDEAIPTAPGLVKSASIRMVEVSKLCTI